jgi:hypothetical protein
MTLYLGKGDTQRVDVIELYAWFLWEIVPFVAVQAFKHKTKFRRLATNLVINGLLRTKSVRPEPQSYAARFERSLSLNHNMRVVLTAGAATEQYQEGPRIGDACDRFLILLYLSSLSNQDRANARSLARRIFMVSLLVS